MRVFPQLHHRIAIILAAAFSTIIVSGCGQPTAQTKESAPATDVTRRVKDSEFAKVTNQEPETSTDLTGLSIAELVRSAAQSLQLNGVEAAKNAMTEARDRDDTDIGSKFDIARILFGAGEMKASVEVYDEILDLRPDIKPQLWQRGLALYYAEEYQKGVDQFDTHQTYNSQDVENSVWQLLCQSRLTSVEAARKTMIQIDRDSRIPMKQVFDMFAGTGTPEEVISACGYDADKIIRGSGTYHGWLYVGLFHEMMGDQEASNEAMKTALKCKPSIPSLMGYVAEGHLRARGAYPVVDR